jgi:hypothetical protein
MAITQLERLYLRDPEQAQKEVLTAFEEAGPRGLTAEDAAFAVEARLLAMTQAELDAFLTIEDCERLRLIVQTQYRRQKSPRRVVARCRWSLTKAVRPH